VEVGYFSQVPKIPGPWRNCQGDKDQQSFRHHHHLSELHCAGGLRILEAVGL
jgi:hypothetical protein